MSESEYFKGAIGIDLGTTNSCVAVWMNSGVEVISNKLGERTTPSWVSYIKKNNNEIGRNGYDVIVGKGAKNIALKNLKNTIYDTKRIIGRQYMTIADPSSKEYKRGEKFTRELNAFRYKVQNGMNNNIEIVIGENTDAQFKTRPEEISAEVLKYMKNIAEDYIGKKVKKAVITVPAYFNDAQKNATSNCAILAGLDCIRLINEPTSACICYGLDKKEDVNVLVFDWGGGTLDCSILSISEGTFSVLSTSGNTRLGGEDLDNCIIDHFKEQLLKKHKIDVLRDLRALHKLKIGAEQLKISLSYQTTAEYDIDSIDGEGFDYTMKLSRVLYEKICGNIFQKCIKPLKQVIGDSHLEHTEITEVVLVGGSTRIPKIQQMLHDYFDGKVNINKSVNPDEAVAYGASIQGAILTSTDTSGKTDDIILVDVIPLTLGVETHGGIMT